MKLTEQDLQDACQFIMHESCKASYGEDYVTKGIHFDLRSTQFTIRQLVDLFIEWLKIWHQKRKANVQKI